MVTKPPSVETDFGAFMKTDVNTSTMRDSFLFALSKRDAGRRLQGGTDLYKAFDVSIVYDLREGSGGARGLFDAEVLSEISRFEESLRQLPEWRELCDATEPADRPLCEPGVSFTSYAMPSLNVSAGGIVPSALRFDGRGRDIVPLETSLLLMEELEVSKILLPSDFSAGDQATSQLRSVFRFRLKCCTSLDTMSYQREVVKKMNLKWNALSQGSLLPVLQGASAAISVGASERKGKPPIRVYYDGSGFSGVEVMQELAGDQRLAGGSVSFVLLYMLLHTRSLLLSIMGLLIIVLAVPLSYVVFTLSTGSQTMSIASFLSIFLIVGLGSDVIFVYSDFWHESKHVKDHQVDRLVWTIWHAGKASFATTATTAVSFFANLASVLKPLREFGFFMGLCVVLVWVLLTLIFLPLCIVDERCPCKCCSRFRDGHGPDSTGSGWSAVAFGSLARALRRRRRRCVLLTAVLTVVAAAWAMALATVDTGVPNIFPEEHNQNRGKKVMAGFPPLREVFDPLFPSPVDSAEVCSEHDFSAGPSCALYWCEVQPSTPVPLEGQCECFRKRRANDCGAAAKASVVQRFVGSEGLSDGDLQGPVGDFLVSNEDDGLAFQAGTDRLQSMAKKNVAGPVVLQEWESGDVMLRSMAEVATSLQRSTRDSSCGWHEMCFCGSYICKMPDDWMHHGQVSLGSPQRMLSAGQPQWEVPSNLRAAVDVVFGLEVAAKSPLLGELDLETSWDFNERHEVRQPWAQRNIYSFCTKLPEELRVTSRRCWIEDFRTYVNRRKLRFPVPQDQFDSEAMSFARNSLTGMSSSKDFLWIRDGEVKASYVSFTIDVHNYATADVALEHKAKWDAYLNRYNADASRFASDAWHTASLWVRAEAQNELVMSTVLTLLIVIILAFVGMVVFTRDPVLSLFVVLATCGVVVGLFFFITVLMGWPIGPIEIIALIVFIGYAVTYSLHVAHRYGSKDALDAEMPAELCEDLPPAGALRYQRTLFALRTIGGAALGSAVTTAGCSIFLLFCTLTIFQKLGAVVLAVTVMSIMMALGPLPALLLMAGPQHPGHVPRLEDLRGCLGGAQAAARNAWSVLLLRLQRPPADSGEDTPHAADVGGHPGLEAGCVSPSSIGRRPATDAAQGLVPAGRPATRDGSGALLPAAREGPPPEALRPMRAVGGGAPGGAQQQARVCGGGPPEARAGGFGGGAALPAGAASACDRRRRLSEMDLDIGTESPLECLWARDSSSMPRTGDGGSKHSAAAAL